MTHPLLLSPRASEPSTLFGSLATSKKRPISFASPPHDGFAFLAERFPEERYAYVTLIMTARNKVVKS